MSHESHPLVRFAVERRITMWMSVVGLVALGLLSLQRLPLEFLPAFASNSISVQVPYSSSSPVEVERVILRPLEDSLATINGVETLTASARAESGNLRLTFFDHVDMDLAAVEVRDRIDRVRHLLPDDVDQVAIRRFQSTDIPILQLHVSAGWPRTRLVQFVETVLVRRLERISGVAQVEVGGLDLPQIQVDLDPARMEAHGVDVREVTRRVAAENRNVSAGDVEVGARQLQLRVVGELRTLDEIRRLPLDARGLRLRDVADVTYGFPRQETFNYLNGVEALTVRINKVSTANLLDVVERVKEELDEIRVRPDAQGLELRVFRDASDDVVEGLGQLRDAGLFGGGLAILAVFLFLRRFRTTALIAVAIPVSIVATFVLMYVLRQLGAERITLNVVSLAGLMLALGMLVDNAIVVIEAIFRQRNELGLDARSAAIAGASEVALPILAATATTLCVFAPLVFLGQGGGRMAIYFEAIGTSVSIVMASSLLVALTVVPMLAARWLAHQAPRAPVFFHRLAAAYGRILAFTLRHRAAFVVAIVLLLVGSVWLFGTIERSFAGRTEERQVEIEVDTPRQYSPQQIAALYDELYSMFDARRADLDIADIAYTYDRSAGGSGGGWRRRRQMELYLVDEAEATKTTAEVRNEVRRLLPSRAGVELRISQGRGPSGATGIEIQLAGAEPSVLGLLAERVAEALRAVPQVRDVDTSLESGDEEIRVAVTPERWGALDLSSQAVAATVRSSLTSRPVTRYATDDREVDVLVQIREEDRETLDQLRNVTVFAGGARRPLGTVADFRRVAGPESIERENHAAQVTVTANLADAQASWAAMGAVRDLMSTLALPPGYSWSFGRWSRFLERDQQSSNFALIFAAILVYMLMAALFESFVQPFVIMFSVPFALVGVAIVMKLTNTQMDTMANLGLIILLGVVVNNAIVLIDHVNRLRRQGLARFDAIVTGGRDRLRPILITAVTTIVGMAPLIAPAVFPAWFGPVEGRAATWIPIGLVITGGLLTSTFLTLLVIPTLYSLADDLARFGRRVLRSL